MGWEDRRYETDGGGGGFRAVVRRIFGDGENPMEWAITLYTAWRIKVKIHLIFVIMIVAELIQSISRNQMNLPYMAIGMGSLFALVLLHEYGHCFACRFVGGTADKILMWPLGGLAYCAPPHHWKADLITTVGGPAVNAVLAPVFALMLILLGQGRDALLFNPFDPVVPLGGLQAASRGLYWTSVTVWWLYYTNAALFLFNVFLPMYPLDGGRVVNALLWRRLGYRRAMTISTTVGMVAAIVLLMFAITGNGSMLLVGVALFGGLTCYVEKRRLAMMADEHPALAGYDFDRGYQGLPKEDEERTDKARQKRLKKEQEDQQELDRILAKIAASGMASLNKAEKRWLEQASERRREA